MSVTPELVRYAPGQNRNPAGQAGGGEFASGSSSSSSSSQSSGSKKPAAKPTVKPTAPHGKPAAKKPAAKPAAKPSAKKPAAATNQSRAALRSEAKNDIQQANQIAAEVKDVQSQIAAARQKLSSLYRIQSSHTSSPSTSSTSGSTAAGSAASTAASAAGTAASAARTAGTSATSAASSSHASVAAQISATQSQITSLQGREKTLITQEQNLRAQAQQLNQEAAKKGVTGMLAKERDSSVGEDLHPGGVDRDSLPDSAFAGPNRSFPVTSPRDVGDAASLAHHADDPDAVRSRIREIATGQLGMSEADLPPSLKSFPHIPLQTAGQRRGFVPAQIRSADFSQLAKNMSATNQQSRGNMFLGPDEGHAAGSPGNPPVSPDANGNLLSHHMTSTPPVTESTCPPSMKGKRSKKVKQYRDDSNIGSDHDDNDPNALMHAIAEGSMAQSSEKPGEDRHHVPAEKAMQDWAHQSRGANALPGTAWDSPSNTDHPGSPGGPGRHPTSGQFIPQSNEIAPGHSVAGNYHTVTPSPLCEVHTVGPDDCTRASSIMQHPGTATVESLNQAAAASPSLFGQLRQPPSGDPGMSRADFTSPSGSGPAFVTPQRAGGGSYSPVPGSMKSFTSKAPGE